MEKQQVVSYRELAQSVGHFIRYWGFRQIHGEIWTLVYLARSPLSGAELVELLGVSKALISPAITQLESEGLIRQIESENAKTKRYVAVDNVDEVIRQVLKRRELPMLSNVAGALESISDEFAVSQSFARGDRLKELKKMVETAQSALAFLIASEDFWK